MAQIAEKNHAFAPGICFIYFKKETGKPRVSYEAAAEEALCFGWIDIPGEWVIITSINDLRVKLHDLKTEDMKKIEYILVKESKFFCRKFDCIDWSFYNLYDLISTKSYRLTGTKNFRRKNFMMCQIRKCFTLMKPVFFPGHQRKPCPLLQFSYSQ